MADLSSAIARQPPLSRLVSTRLKPITQKLARHIGHQYVSIDARAKIENMQTHHGSKDGLLVAVFKSARNWHK
jgi:hypothetical protein